MKQSSTKDDDNEQHGAALAIDMNMDTQSDTGVVYSWLKLNLGREHCVEKVIVHLKNQRNWTCTKQDCSSCTGSGPYCDFYVVTVGFEEGESTLTPVSDCKYGDSVRIEKVYGNSGNPLSVKEMIVIGRQGKIISLHLTHI